VGTKGKTFTERQGCTVTPKGSDLVYQFPVAKGVSKSYRNYKQWYTGALTWWRTWLRQGYEMNL
jgi:hypothetical protein